MGSELASRVVPALLAPFQTLEGQIKEKVIAAEQGEAEYKVYRQKEGVVDRAASYKESKVLVLAWLLVVACLESSINSPMFLGGSAGWINALLTAFAVSISNILLAAAAALLWRYVDLPNLADAPNRKRNNRLWSIPAVTACVSVLVLINAFAAHWREICATEETFDEKQVLQHMLEKPFDLSLSSVILFVVGLLAAAFAAYKAWSSTDPLPGYEKATRRYLGKIHARDDLRTSLQGQLDAVRATEVEGAVNRCDAKQALIDDAERRYAQLQVDVARAEKLDAADCEAGEAAIRASRKTNLSIRADGVVPKIYTTPVKLDEMVTVITHDDVPHLIEAARESLDTVKTAVDQAVIVERRRVQLAKEYTGDIMRAIAKAKPAEKIPEMAEVRSLLEKAGTAGAGSGSLPDETTTTPMLETKKEAV